MRNKLALGLTLIAFTFAIIAGIVLTDSEISSANSLDDPYESFDSDDAWEIHYRGFPSQVHYIYYGAEVDVSAVHNMGHLLPRGVDEGHGLTYDSSGYGHIYGTVSGSGQFYINMYLATGYGTYGSERNILFEIAAYDVKFETQGGTNCDTQHAPSINLPNTTRDHYIFDGWYTEATGGERIGGQGSSFQPRSNTTLYAHWTPIYTVSCYDGEQLKYTKEVTRGNYANLYAISKNNYDFNGWFTSNIDGTQIYDDFKPSCNINVYAHWKCTVTFNGNGGTVSQTSTTFEINKSDYQLNMPSVFWNDHEPDGWHTASTDGIEVDETYIPNGHSTLYVHWKCTVTFNGNGGTVDQNSTDFEFNNSNYRFSLPSATWSDHESIGWYTASIDGTKISDSYIPDGDSTLYAHWNCTVIFNNNGGDSNVEPIIFELNSSTFKYSPETVYKAKYGFIGWFTESTGGTKTDNTYRPNGNSTLYAHWKSTVVFDGNGSSIDIDSIDVDYNSSNNYFNLPSATRNGHLFVGWHTYNESIYNSDGIYRPDSSFTPSGNTRLYAIWFEIEPTMIIGSDNLVYDYSDNNLTIYNINENGNISSLYSGILTDKNNVEHDISDMTSCTLAKDVISIPHDAFRNCSDLRTFVALSENDDFSSDNGVLFNKNKTILIKYPAGCSDTEYNIPTTVTGISEGAFAECVHLNSIQCNSSNSFSSVDGVLFNKNGTTLIAYPAGKTSDSYLIPDTVDSIAPGAFMDASDLKTISVSKNNSHFTSVSGVLFSKGCKNLEVCPSGKYIESYDIPETVWNIKDYAFYGCESLTTVTVPYSVSYIGRSSFEYCTSLENVFLNSRVDTIGDYAFNGCSSLKEIDMTSVRDCDFGTGVFENIFEANGTQIFSNNLSGKRFIMIDGKLKVTQPTASYISGNSGYVLYSDGLMIVFGTEPLTGVSFSDTVRNNAIELVIADGVTSIASLSFNGFTKLEYVKIASTVNSIAGDSFVNITASKLNYVELPYIGNNTTMNFGGYQLTPGNVYAWDGESLSPLPGYTYIRANITVNGNEDMFDYTIFGTGFHKTGSVASLTAFYTEDFHFEGWYYNGSLYSDKTTIQIYSAGGIREFECRFVQNIVNINVINNNNPNVTVDHPTTVGSGDEWSFKVTVDRYRVINTEGTIVKNPVVSITGVSNPIYSEYELVGDQYVFTYSIGRDITSSDTTITIEEGMDNLVQHVSAETNYGTLKINGSTCPNANGLYTKGSQVSVTIEIPEDYNLLSFYVNGVDRSNELTWQYTVGSNHDAGSIRIGTYTFDILCDTNITFGFYNDTFTLNYVRDNGQRIQGNVSVTYGTGDNALTKTLCSDGTNSVKIMDVSEVSSIIFSLPESEERNFGWYEGNSAYNYIANDFKCLSGCCDTYIVKSVIGTDLTVNKIGVKDNGVIYDVVNGEYHYVIAKIYENGNFVRSVSAESYCSWLYLDCRTTAKLTDIQLIFYQIDDSGTECSKFVTAIRSGVNNIEYYFEDIGGNSAQFKAGCETYAQISYKIDGVKKFIDPIKLNISLETTSIDRGSLLQQIATGIALPNNSTTTFDFEALNEILGNKLGESGFGDLFRYMKITLSIEIDPLTGKIDVLLCIGKVVGCEYQNEDAAIFKPCQSHAWSHPIGSGANTYGSYDGDHQYTNNQLSALYKGIDKKSIFSKFECVGSASVIKNKSFNIYGGGYLHMVFCFDSGTLKTETIEGCIQFAFNYEFSFGGTVVAWGIPFYWELGTVGAFSGGLNIKVMEHGQVITPSITIDNIFNNEFFIGGGVGVRAIACAGIYIGVEFNIHAYMRETPNGTTETYCVGSIQLNGYLFAKALFLEKRQDFYSSDPFILFSDDPDVQTSWGNIRDIMLGNETSNGNWTISSVEYRTHWNGDWQPWDNDAETLLEMWAYQYAEPIVECYEGNNIMLMLADKDQDNPDRQTSDSYDNSSVLMYSWYDGLNWSSPQRITPGYDSYADMSPHFYKIDGHLYIIWSRGEVTDDDITQAVNSGSIVNILNKCDLWFAEWDSETKSFVNVSKITDEKSYGTEDTFVYEDEYCLFDHDGTLCSMWLVNGTNTVFYISEYTNDTWSTPIVIDIGATIHQNADIQHFEVTSYENDVLSYTLTYSYTEMGEDNVISYKDVFIFNSDVIDAITPTYIQTIGNNTYYLDDGCIYKLENGSTTSTCVFTGSISEFHILESETETYIFWTEENTIYAAKMINGSFSGSFKAYQIDVGSFASEEVYKFATFCSVSFSMDDNGEIIFVGTICISENDVFTYYYDENSESAEHTDPVCIIWGKITFDDRLSLDIGSLTTDNVIIGEKTITVIVKNEGISVQSNVFVTLRDGDKYYRYLVANTLNPGEEIFYDIEYNDIIDSYRTVCIRAESDSAYSDTLDYCLSPAVDAYASMQFIEDDENSFYIMNIDYMSSNASNLNATISLIDREFVFDGGRIVLGSGTVNKVLFTEQFTNGSSKSFMKDIPFRDIFTEQSGAHASRSVLREIKIVLTDEENNIVCEYSELVTFYNFRLVSIYFDYTVDTDGESAVQQIYGYPGETISLSNAPDKVGWRFTGQYRLYEYGKGTETVCTLPEQFTFPDHTVKYVAIYVSDGLYGKCGESAYYTISETDDEMILLTIFGTGTVSDNSQWNADIKEIDGADEKDIKVAICDGITGILNDVFKGQERLRYVSLPSTIEFIDSEMFDGCTDLEDIDELDVKGYSIIDGMLFRSEKIGDVDGYVLLKVMVASDELKKDIDFRTYSINVIEISSGVFRSTAIRSIIAPDVIMVSEFAFANCSSLNCAYLPNAEIIDDYAFYRCSSLTELRLSPDEYTDETGLMIGYDLETIGEGALQSCSALDKANMSSMSKLTSIGKEAFSECTLLSVVSFPTSECLELGANAFSGSSLTTIDLTSALQNGKIADSAFSNCSELVSFTGSPTEKYPVRDGILYKQIEGGYALMMCPNKYEQVIINIASDVIEIDYSEIFGKKSVEAFIVDQNNPVYRSIDGIVYRVVNGESKTFELVYCPISFQKTSITIGNGDFIVSKICSNAFNNVSSLREVFIYGNVVEISAGAFSNCDGLQIVNMRNASGIIYLNTGSFTHCLALESVTMPVISEGNMSAKGKYCTVFLSSGLSEKTTMLYCKANMATWADLISANDSVTFTKGNPDYSIGLSFLAALDKSGSVTLSNDYLSNLLNNNADLILEGDSASMELPAEMIKILKEKGNTTLKAEFRKATISDLTEDERNIVGDRPVFVFNLTGIDDIHELGGIATITVRYDLREGEDGNNLTVWYINDGEMKQKMDCTYFEENGLGYVSFETDHLSSYAIFYEENTGADQTAMFVIIAVIALVCLLVLGMRIKNISRK